MRIIDQVGRFVPDAILRKYLLGELNAKLRGVLERVYFMDDDLYRRLKIVEAELADDYVFDRLSEPQRARFETNYLTSATRRDYIAMAEALRDDATAAMPLRVRRSAYQRFRWARWSIIAAFSLVALVAWIFQAHKQSVFAVIVSPSARGDLRSPVEGGGPVSVPRGTRRVRFEVRPRGPRSGGYSAVLRVDGAVVHSTGELQVSDSGAVGFDVPIGKLRTGTYSIELTAKPAPGMVALPQDFRFELLVHP